MLVYSKHKEAMVLRSERTSVDETGDSLVLVIKSPDSLSVSMSTGLALVSKLPFREDLDLHR
jgi:hypothetical protein